MAISGLIGAGAAEGLDQFLVQLLRQRQMEEVERRAKAQEGLEGERNEILRKREESDNAYRDQVMANQEAEGTRRVNLADMRRRVGDQGAALMDFPPEVQQREAMGLLSRIEPETALRSMAAPPPQPRRRTATVRGPNGEPINTTLAEDESAVEYERPQGTGSQPSPRIDVRNIASRGPNGEPGTKLVVFRDGVPVFEQWEPGNPSATERKDLGDFSTLESAFRDVSEVFEANPDAVGPLVGRVNQAQQVIPGVEPSEPFADLSSKLAQVQNSLIYLKSGKQINEQEFVRLQRELPLLTDKAPIFRTKLANAISLMKTFADNRRAIVGVPNPVPSHTPGTGDRVIRYDRNGKRIP